MGSRWRSRPPRAEKLRARPGTGASPGPGAYSFHRMGTNGRVLWQGPAAVVAIALSLALAAPAGASIPASLTSPASCNASAPAPGFSYTFCDDGVPRASAARRRTRSARTRSPCPPSTSLRRRRLHRPAGEGGRRRTMPGADAQGNIALDVDLSIPRPGRAAPAALSSSSCTAAAPGTRRAGRRRLRRRRRAVALLERLVRIARLRRHQLHGTRLRDGSRPRLHRRDAPRLAQLRDQRLSGPRRAAARFDSRPAADIDPSKVVATGGSYGGGFSWMALTDPNGRAPPTRRRPDEPRRGRRRSTAGPTSSTPSSRPAPSSASRGAARHQRLHSGPRRIDGTPSRAPTPDARGDTETSINAGLYASGKTGIPPGSAHTTFPASIDEAQVCLTGPYPAETSPLCANTLQNTLPEFLRDRIRLLPEPVLRGHRERPQLPRPRLRRGDLHRSPLPRDREPADDQPAQRCRDGQRLHLSRAGLLRRLPALHAGQGEDLGRRL